MKDEWARAKTICPSQKTIHNSLKNLIIFPKISAYRLCMFDYLQDFLTILKITPMWISWTKLPLQTLILKSKTPKSNSCVSYESWNYWTLEENKNSMPSKRPSISMTAEYKTRTEGNICNFFIQHSYLSKDSGDPS